jgi:hypothetical protein
MTNFVPSLRAEISELEADIRHNPDPRVRKLQRLREALAEYEPVRASEPPKAASVPPTNGLEALRAFAADAAMSKAAKMKAYLRGYLEEKGTAHRKELLEKLIQTGIMGKEKDPMQALAIYLSSNKDIFEFDGSGNYSLREGSGHVAAAT